MYLRTTTRRAADGTLVRYLQLAHNEWDPAARRSKVRVLYHFGREDELDRDAIRRLIGSLSRALPPGEALIATAPPELRFSESRPLGGAWALDGLWRRLGLPEILARALRGRLGVGAGRHPGSRGALRRSVLPGDGLAHGDRGRDRAAGLLGDRDPAQP